jgi:acetyl esterase
MLLLEQISERWPMSCSETYIRPDVRAYLDGLVTMPRPPMNDALIAQIRTIPPEMPSTMALQDLPLGDLGVVRDVVMPAPDGEIALRLFDVRATRDPGPVVVFYHGGGYVLGSIATHASLAAELSRRLDLPVVSVEYRLAPEHPWPAAPDDAEAAARWIADNAAVFQRSFTGLVLCGDSAGGTLTIVTALALRDNPASMPLLAQLPIYPKVDFTRHYPSDLAFSQGYALDRADMEYFNVAYGVDPQHPRGSPLVADHAGLPPTLVITASLDPLRDNGRAYAAALALAGVDTTYREMRGTIHGFCSYRALIPSARDDLAEICALAAGIIERRRKELNV